MNQIAFTIPGPAKSTQTGSIIRLKDGRAFPSRRNTDYAAKVALFAQQAKTKQQWQTTNSAVAVTLLEYRKRPKTAKRVYPIVKPDVDNLAKSVLDSMSGIIYFDDSQVVQLTLEKLYTQGDPLLEINIYTLD